VSAVQPVSVADLRARFEQVRQRVRRAGGDWDAITLVAVTKGFGPAYVAAARELGQRDFGENYARELATKAAGPAGPQDVRWHYLGAVQRDTARRLRGLVHLWQGVADRRGGERVAAAEPGAHVLVQVNVSGEPQKQGCTFGELPGLVDALQALALDVRGLMALGPTGPPEAAREGFRRLSAAADRLRLPVRSMGMSADLEVAVQEGSTMLRLGTALFGPRPPGA
jgi:pyridoxal phosphate enzyme (YggS family)